MAEDQVEERADDIPGREEDLASGRYVRFRRLALDRARGVQHLRAGGLMDDEQERCGDLSCLICYALDSTTAVGLLATRFGLNALPSSCDLNM
jgi:hypothetical protein